MPIILNAIILPSWVFKPRRSIKLGLTKIQSNLHKLGSAYLFLSCVDSTGSVQDPFSFIVLLYYFNNLIVNIYS